MFSDAGIPTVYSFDNKFLLNETFFFENETGRGFINANIIYAISVAHCPIPVAYAAPAMPISGKKPMPNIISGSRTIFAINPTSIQNIVVFIRPTA